ncbi:GAF and ANTAR domain-containing protein [Microbacteriaceae bacterium VKM Ac-2854]|nr:GAF and ANTAR domain-containing protein [Microbacteriaceae bacterium VKM Ac-2854]
MSGRTREQLLVETFVAVADTLVEDYDVVTLLHDLVDRCASIFEATDVGIILAAPQRELVVVASTSERTRLIELLQLSGAGGPCLEAFQTGRMVTASDAASIAQRWPAFAAHVDGSGYQSMQAVPMRLREQTIGSLNLFNDRPGHLGADDAAAVQALADVATIGILHERLLRDAVATRAQLQHALVSRVVIEQAKGVVAHRRRISPDEAFQLLRRRARSHQARLTDVAQAVIDGLITV